MAVPPNTFGYQQVPDRTFTLTPNVTFNELDNQTVDYAVLDVLAQKNFIWKHFYDPNIEVEGSHATFYGKQTNEAQPYHNKADHSDVETSGSLKHEIPLIEFGRYSDKYSTHFGKLAFSNPQLLKRFLDLHHAGLTYQLSSDVNRKFKEDMENNDNFAPLAIIENFEDYYEAGRTDDVPNGDIIWQSIRTIATELCEESNLYNVAGARSVVYGYENLILIMHPKVEAVVESKLANTYNVGRIDPKMIYGGIGVTNFTSSYFSEGTEITKYEPNKDPKQPWTPQKKVTKRGEKYESATRMLLLSKDFYKIVDTINPGIDIDTTRVGISLHTYIHKWFYAHMGSIPFINGVKWVSTGKRPEA